MRFTIFTTLALAGCALAAPSVNGQEQGMVKRSRVDLNARAVAVPAERRDLGG
ncbi:hypothetical protein JCM6882_003718, partial [Rhodosporidiobolus microsporus]